MAIRPLLTVLAHNMDVDKATDFVAGACLARDSSGGSAGLVRKADRASDATTAFVGFSADDKSRTGLTMILIDPVGSSVVSSDGVTFTAANNGYFVAPKRVLGGFADESVTEISDLTSGASGRQGPRRGVGVYFSQSAQFVTDQFAAVATTSTTADDVTPLTFAPNDLLTFGAGANAGKVVKLASTTHGKTIARVDSYDASAGLLYITQL